MLMDDLQQIFSLMNPWWEKKEFSAGLTREKYLSLMKQELQTKQIVFLSGLRRVGKTTLLKQLIHYLLSTTEPKRIFYLTMDFISFKDKTIHQLVEEYRKMHSIGLETPIYVFLDEVTQSSSFEQELKNFYDLENIKFFASSSSASLLKSKNNYLVGRSLIIEVLPLDFTEFLQFKNINILPSEQYLLESYFEEYLKIGGMPEYVLTQDVNCLKNTIEQILYKDIIAYHNIKEKDIVEKMFQLLCERAGKTITLSKLARVLSVSVDTIRRFLEYFKDTFLFYSIDRYAKSLNEKIHSPKKLYIADVGIRNAFVGFKDKGSLVENLVYLKIKQYPLYYYFENNKEIDFIILIKKKTIAIEVKYKKKIEEKELEFFEKSSFSKKILVKQFKDIEDINNVIIS